MSELIAQNNSEQFSLGTFENTAIINESISLCQTGKSYIPSGCYTTQVFSCAPFTRLVASVCCDTPCKTAFELLVRVMYNGVWSRWLTFGKYSPLMRRTTENEECDTATLSQGILSVTPSSGAEAFQLKVYLYSDNTAHTPVINMVSASVKPLHPQKQTSEHTQRELPVPVYSQMLRNPALCGKIALPTAVAMLLNRHGEDVLPEQIAHAMFDYATKDYNNVSFSAAICGAYGYNSAAVFCDISFIKKEIRQGYAMAALLNNGAVVVKGFDISSDGNEYIVINNPNAQNNEESEQKMPLAAFEQEYRGICVLLHDKRKGAGTAAPACRPATIKKIANEYYTIYVSGLPVKIEKHFLQNDGICEGTICASAKNTTAFASAAQKSFEYLDASPDGDIVIKKDLFSAGTKITVYVIDNTGNAYASEIIV